MSRINFDTLTEQYPKLDSVWAQLDSWLKKNPRLRTIDPRRVAGALDDVPSEILAEAFYLLVKDGWLEQKYQLESSRGVFEGPVFDTPNEIPEQVTGRFDESLNTESCQIVPIFREREEASAMQ